MKKIRLFLSLLLMMFAFSVVCVNTTVEAAGAQEVSADAYDTDAKKVQFDLDRISLPTNVIASFPVVTKSMFGSSFTWESTNSDVISTEYVNESGWIYVQRSSEESKTVTLKVTATLNEESDEKQFEITVPAGTTSTQEVQITYKDAATGEAIVEEGQVTKVHAGDALNLVAPTKAVDGKYFAGWYDNQEGTGRKYITTLGIIKDVTLYAKYEAVVLESLTLDSSTDLSAYPQTAKSTTLTSDLLNNLNLNFKYAHLTSTGSHSLKDALDNNLVTVSFDTDTETDKVIHYNSKLVITSTEDSEKSVEVAIIVNKLNPTVKPVVTGSYYENVKLSVVSLSLGEGSTEGTIVWKNEETTLVKGDNTCTWKFTPRDLDYNTTEGNITVNALENTVTKTGVKEIKAVLNDAKKQYSAYDTMSTGDLIVTVVYNMSNNTTSDETTTEYTITYQNGDYFKAGDTKVTITYTVSETSYTFDLTVNTVAKKVLNAPENVTFTSVYTYDGVEHKVSHTGLDESTYTISYSENNKLTNKGSVEVTVTYGAVDSANCEVNSDNATTTVTLTVNAKSIEGVTISDVADIVVDTRTFDQKTPEVTVSDGETALVKDTDYTVTYSETTEIESGKTSVIATITVTGKGNYDGSATKEFTIKLSATAKVDEDAAELSLTTINTDEVDELPTTLTNGSKVVFTELPQFVEVENGKLKVIKTSSDQSETVTVTVTNEDIVRYVNVTFTASAKVNKYKVTFNVGTGTSTPTIADQYVNPGEKVLAPTTNPTKEDYVFVEWQLNGSKFDFNTIIDKDIELVAKYGQWQLVTDASDLAAGDKIVIAAKDYDVALSFQNGSSSGNNRAATSITKDTENNTITVTDDDQVITLEEGTKENTFALYTGGGYLYAASSSSNYLKTQEKKDDNASFSITINDSGDATVKAQGTNTHNLLRYNRSSKLFSCYESGQNDIVIYKLVLEK